MPTVDLSALLCEVTRSSFTWRTPSTCLSPAASDWFLQTANNGSQFLGKDLGCSPECFCIKWHGDSAARHRIVTHSESSSAHWEQLPLHARVLHLSCIILSKHFCSDCCFKSLRLRTVSSHKQPATWAFPASPEKGGAVSVAFVPVSLLRVWQDYSSLRFLLWLCL